MDMIEANGTKYGKDMPTQEKQVQGLTGSQMAQKNGIHPGDNMSDLKRSTHP